MNSAIQCHELSLLTLMSTQFGHPSIDVMKPVVGDALWLGSKGMYGSCLMAGKSCITSVILERLGLYKIIYGYFADS